MKDVATPVPQQEVRAVIKKCLENAALVNYERLSQEAKIEGKAVHSASLLIPLIQPHVKVHLLEKQSDKEKQNLGGPSSLGL